MPTPEALSLVHLIRHAVDMSDEECASEIDRFAAQRGAEALREPRCRMEQFGDGSCDCPQCMRMRGAPPQTGGGDAFLTTTSINTTGADFVRLSGETGWTKTGGGGAPHPIDGWTPEIMAEEARRFDEGLPAALDQFEKATAGGDAGLTIRNPAPDGTPPSMPTGRNATITIQRGQPGGGDAGERELFDRKTAINIRVQARYDELMREGKHGHYETMFRIIHEERRSSHREGAEAMREADALCLEGADIRAIVKGVDLQTEATVAKVLLELARRIRARPIPGK